MKKLYILFITLFLFVLSSCPGVLAGNEYIEIHIFKEDNTQLTVGELENLNFSPAGKITLLQPNEEYTESKTAYMFISYYIGSARSEKKYKKIYEERMRFFSFRIEDPYNKYETYDSYLHGDKYTKMEHGVKYSITLKEKTKP